MKSFLLSVIKLICALCLAIFIVGFLFITFIIGLVTLFQKPPVFIENNTVLMIDLSMAISDSSEKKEFSESLQDLIQAEYIPKAYLLEVLDAIEYAAKDPRIIGIYLEGNIASNQQESGYPVLHEVRKALEEFKKTGKLVVSYFVDADVKDYFIGSVATKVVMNPLGQLSLKGLSYEMIYFGDAFQKYGIGVQITKVGKYKSAVDPFISNKMSDSDKEQSKELLANLWDNILTITASGRSLDKDSLQTLSHTEGLFLSTTAKEHQLIDEIAYQDEAFDYFKLEDNKNETPNKVTLKKYINNIENKLNAKIVEHKNQVAVLYAEGDIVDGEGYSYEVGADRIERKIKKIQEDSDIKAVVLRVNSPGGGVHASEKIQHAIHKLQLKKPVVVSFGSVAASGGYWISCYANAIFADPMTITGSIGVFGLLFNVQDIANNYGIHFDRVMTGPFAGMDSFGYPKTSAEMAKIQTSTDLMYQTFLTKVSEGRKLNLQAVEDIAQGRVWSGLKAKEIGLVDFYGGLKDAINHAAKIADLGDNWELKPYSNKSRFPYNAIEFFQDSNDEQKTRIGLISKYIKYFKKNIQNLNKFNDPSNIYTQMPTTFILN